MIKKVFLLLAATLMCQGFVLAQASTRHIRTPEYRKLQQNLSKGWNTWNTNSVLSHVLLPEAFAVNLCLKNENGGPSYQREFYKASKQAKRQEQIVLGLRSDDGSYTSLQMKWGSVEFTVESAAEGDDLVIFITTARSDKDNIVDVIIESGILWGRPGELTREGNTLIGKFAARTISVNTSNQVVANDYVFASSPYLAVRIEGEIGISAGKARSLEEIRTIVKKRRQDEADRSARYGELADAFRAMQTVLAWNAVYDPGNDRVISPVSRNWSNGWGGFVLFDWDTYFASYMYASFNRELAYANAIEITKSITPQGFIPNYASAYNRSTWDRSQPPVGSTIVKAIYRQFKEKWFLEEVYDELLAWNRWWPKNRDFQGYLSWGSVPVEHPNDDAQGTWQAAAFESGLDNSPMFDGVPYDSTTHLMKLADVGLMSFYIADSKALAEISDVLGKKEEARELRSRAESYTKSLAGLWDETKGIFLNKRTDTGEKSYRISPTNFYPLLAGACTERQAERMMKEHYFNTEEFQGEYVIPSIARNDSAFKDNDYWRGRIWAPMNFLVYLGMRNYDIPDARADLVKRSLALLMKSWKANGAIYENYNSVTGEGEDVGSADAFYHWGALLGYMSFIEKGYVAKPEGGHKP